VNLLDLNQGKDYVRGLIFSVIPVVCVSFL